MTLAVMFFLVCAVPGLLPLLPFHHHHHHQGFVARASKITPAARRVGERGAAAYPTPTSASATLGAAAIVAVAADGALATLWSSTTLSPTTGTALAGVEVENPPAITSAPEAPDAAELAIKFRQTTYYSCVTLGTYTHCGTHEPILDASGAAPGATAAAATRAVWAAILAAVATAFLPVGI